ncbi:MAG TPA: DUF3784 domain-containing protein [Chondromyces sp.]|nr:DUF3784 domain-containing protein [Chondromyces sp.]
MIMVIQLLLAVMFFILGWALRHKKAYWLISGFASRPEEEQKQLIENGFVQKTGTLLVSTAVGMLILLPLSFTGFDYSIDVQFGFMLVFLMGGMVYISKYEVPAKRKRSYIISLSLFVIVIGFVGYLSYLGYQDYEIVFKKNSFEITGMYGKEWDYKDIQEIELMKEMPEVTRKQNGFGLQRVAKGVFTVTGYGRSLLFVKKDSSPYLYIKTKERNIFINSENEKQTMEWYEQFIQRRKE